MLQVGRVAEPTDKGYLSLSGHHAPRPSQSIVWCVLHDDLGAYKRCELSLSAGATQTCIVSQSASRTRCAHVPDGA